MKPSIIAATLTMMSMMIGATTMRAQVITQKNITLEAARKVAADAVAYAKANNAPGGSIAIVDNGGNLLYLERLDNTFSASTDVAIQKAKTAAQFKAPSKKLEDAVNNGRNALITVGRTFLQGGIPIIYEGQIIGAIGVSGAASAAQDEEIAIAGSKAKLN
ncbi:MAG: heme-binding protein [Chitinophagaceae bacterium]